MNQATTIYGVKVRSLLAFLLSVLLVIASTGTAAALESLSLYDDFTAPKISATKWFGAEGRDNLGLEAKRGISNGQLQLNSRSVGFTASDSGVGTNFVSLGHPIPDNVTAMKATITVTALSTPGCAANTDPTQGSYAVLEGSFFNAGSPTSGDQTDDVVAAVGISRSSLTPAGPLSVIAFVIQCGDKSCSGDLATSIGTTQLGGAVAIGTAVKVEIQWDPTNHQFIFTRGAGTTANIGYDVSDVAFPGLPFKNLAVFNNVANCTTPPQPIANITALFDNVFLNQCGAEPSTCPAFCTDSSQCTNPPSTTCNGNLLTTYSSSGTCGVGNTCDYGPVMTACANGCFNAACNSTGPSYASDATGSSKAGAVTLDKEPDLNASSGTAPALGPIRVSITTTPNNGFQTLTMDWTNDDFGATTPVAMTISHQEGGVDTWVGSIPQQPGGTTVRFFFDGVAWDGVTHVFNPGNGVNYTYVTQ